MGFGSSVNGDIKWPVLINFSRYNPHFFFFSFELFFQHCHYLSLFLHFRWFVRMTNEFSKSICQKDKSCIFSFHKTFNHFQLAFQIQYLKFSCKSCSFYFCHFFCYKCPDFITIDLHFLSLLIDKNGKWATELYVLAKAVSCGSDTT